MRRGVVFDLDETLIDRQASIALYGLQFHKDFRQCITQDVESFLATFLGLDGNGYVPRETFFEHLANCVGHPDVPAAAVAEHFFAHAWTAPIPMAGAIALCERLRASGVLIGVVTNGGSRNQRRKLENSGLHPLIDQILISQEVGVKKPQPAIFLEVCARLDIQPRHSWFVGDHPEFDIAGAKHVGFRTVWLKRGLPWPESLARCYDVEATNLEDVAATLLQ